MKTIIRLSFAFTILLFSCSDDNETHDRYDKHELLYMATSDSLTKYMDVPSIKTILEKDSTILDYTTLDYHSFKKKYSLNSANMDQMAESLKVTYQIASTLETLENNMQQIEIEETDRPKNMENTEYSFNTVKPIEYSKISDEDSNNIRILLETSDSEIK